MMLNYTQVSNYLYNAGFRGIDLQASIKICNCESSFNTHAHNTNGEDSRGLMQINVEAHQEYEHLNLFDPQINCNVAYEIYRQRGKTFKDWTCAKILKLENPSQIYLGIGLAFIASAIYISVAQ